MRAAAPDSIKHRLVVLLCIATLGIALAGCGDDDSDSDGETDGTPSATASTGTDQSGSTDDASDGPKSHGDGTAGDKALLAAAETTLKRIGDGTVVSIDSERNGTVWEVQVVTPDGIEHEADVAKDGSKIISGPRTDQTEPDDRAENRRELKGAKLDYRAAVEKVLAARNGTITELNLDDDRGATVWEADVHHQGTKSEVKIDAATGEVVANRARTGDDDDDDDD